MRTLRSLTLVAAVACQAPAASKPEVAPLSSPPAATPDASASATQPVTVTGTVVAIEATKSHESYCAGGSTFFALDTANGRTLLGSSRDSAPPSAVPVADFVGKSVRIEGESVTRTFTEAEHCPDPAMQCISGPLTCTWLRPTAVVPM